MRKFLVLLLISSVTLSAPEHIHAQGKSEAGFFEKMKAKKAERETKRRRKAAHEEWERNYQSKKNRHLQMQDEKTRMRMLQNQKRDRKEAQMRDHSWWERMKRRL